MPFGEFDAAQKLHKPSNLGGSKYMCQHILCIYNIHTRVFARSRERMVGLQLFCGYWVSLTVVGRIYFHCFLRGMFIPNSVEFG